VEEGNLTASQQQALEALLDDESPGVRQGLLAQFARRGPASVSFLQGVARRADHDLAGHASWFLRQLRFADPVGEFRAFIQSLNYELETGALLLSRTVNADVDVGACCAQLDALAARCRQLIAEPATIREKCRILNRVLFHEHGLRGDPAHAPDPRHSFLDQVLIRRTGIPISLSIVYLLVGERVGLQLEPVGLPGHFVVGCYDEPAPFFIDAFNGGNFLGAEQVCAQLKDHAIEASLADLAPTPVREVLCRCCRNLIHQYAAAGEPGPAQLFAEFAAEFEATHERHTSS
jgi:regulator of sirC expression with transglutaminase-like and TPR domain